MKKNILLFFVAISILSCYNNSLFAQAKKGKTTKSKELVKCEKVADSLVLVIQKLESEISDLKSKNEQLIGENAGVKMLIESGSALTVTNIKVENSTESKGDKVELTTKAKSVSKTTIIFEFIQNGLVPIGSKSVNVVIFDSKGRVVNSQNKKFILKKSGEEKSCSFETQVDYKEKAEKNNIDILYTKKLLPGKYKVEIYISGLLSGKSEFTLD